MATAAAHLTVQPTMGALKPAHSDSSLLDSYNKRDFEFRRRQSSERETTSSEEGEDVMEAEKTESDRDQEVDSKHSEIDDEIQPLEDENFRGRMDSQGRKSRTASITEIRAHAFDKLQEELMKAQKALQLKDEQVIELSRVREEMDREIEELTANLFEEAHAMVREANIARAAAEKKLKETTGKIDMLQAEVQALKLLVITSTPSSPHPVSQQFAEGSKKKPIFKRSKKKDKEVGIYSHQRNHSLQGPMVFDSNGTTPSPTSTTSVTISTGENQGNQVVTATQNNNMPKREVDPLLLRDFEKWRSTPTLSREDQFVLRVFSEDVQPCLNFTNQVLSKSVLESVESNTLSMEPWNEKGSGSRRCALTDQQRPCLYRIKLGESGDWCYICPAARNRIAAVCDYYTYLRYITQGLVKSDLQEVYWEMTRLRKEMSLAKLGLQ